MLKFTNKKEVSKIKKDIKWYTYVDKRLDEQLKDFVKRFDIKSQAKAIRQSVDLFLYFAEFIQEKYIKSNTYNKEQIKAITMESLKSYKAYHGFYEEIKQQISPLKTAILIASEFSNDHAKMSSSMKNIEKAVNKLERVIRKRFEQPSPLRFQKEFDILHIEDNELDREIIKAYFEEKGLTVNSVETAEEALELLKYATPRIILLDLDLKTSNIQGDELCKRLKGSNDYRNIPIVIMTAIITRMQKHDIISETKADGLIIKPIKELKEIDKILDYI